MVALPTADNPERSRVFTILGWLCILLGLCVPIQSTIEYVQALREWKHEPFVQRNLLLSLATHGILSVFGIVAMMSGWGLWRRRSWAPLLASAVGGAVLVECVWWLLGVAPILAQPISRLIEVRNWLDALKTGFPIATTGVRLVVWLVVLGALFRADGRREFPPGRPPFSMRVFFMAIGSGVAIMILCNAVLSWLWAGSGE